MNRKECRAYWHNIITEHADSGQSAVDFCRERDIRIHQFYSWRCRLRKEEAPDHVAGFLELVPFSKRTDSGVRLHLDTGLRIEVERGFDPHTLRA